MIERKPLCVDIICSVYNPGPNLWQSVNSIVAQTYLNWCLILVDDGSTQPQSLLMLEKIASADPRIQLVLQELNVGLSRNLYERVAKSTADYIARIDAGDCWKPEKLACQIQWLESHPDVWVLGTQCFYIDEQGNEVGHSWFAENHDAILDAIAKHRGVFEHSSIMFRPCINYRPEFKMSQDLDLYLRAMRKGRLHCLPEPLTRCEINRSGLTIQKRYLQRKYQQLAYRSCRSLTRTSQDVTLHVSDGIVERKLWQLAQPFYIGYVTARTEKRSVAVWLSYLILTLLLYPPLMKDYLTKGLATFSLPGFRNNGLFTK